jgi:predicted metal-dependent hydrolase
MVRGEAMKTSTHHRIRLAGRSIDFRVVASKTARKLRVRVGPDGVEIVQPAGRGTAEASDFLVRNEAWVLGQLERAARLRIRRPARPSREILYRGTPTRVQAVSAETRSNGNRVYQAQGAIVVERGFASTVSSRLSLENWLRKQARREIQKHLAIVCDRLQRSPERVQVRGQRTKWGNCSARRTLSFNWRLILAPEFVLRYLVTHEAVHLAVPDHSAKFWLTVQSICPESERARQWLCANRNKLLDLPDDL